MIRKASTLLPLLISMACGGAVHHDPGQLAPGPPTQEGLADARPLVIDEYTITPLASFSLKARILAKERYRFDREAELAPYDLALGWGAMSDQAVVDQIRIRQYNRWYKWRTRNWPIKRHEIQTSSANMHMIPAVPEIRDEIGAARVGHIIELEGYLVSVTAEDGWHWRSSLTRDDTRGGSCELVWVEKFTIIE